MRRGRGSAAGFWAPLSRLPWATNPKSIIVQTCTLDHPAALPLYQKLGFEPLGQSKEIITPMSHEERARVLARE
jgi:predicted GNAT family acetyltransferase